MTARLPIEPLSAVAHAPSIEIFAQRIGRSSRTVHRWKNHGVPRAPAAADSAAVSIGSHPAYVWMADWGSPA